MAKKIILRPYQKTAIEETAGAIMFGETNVVIEAPTAAGKSIIIAGLSQEFNDKSIAIIVNITALIDQIAEHLDLMNIEYSILKAGRESLFNPTKRIQLCMSQTLHSRLDKININCDIAIYDEIHKEYNTTRTSDIRAKLKPDARIGLSATIYDQAGFLLHGAEVVKTATVQELQDAGYLCPIKYYAPKWAEKVDYSSIAKSGDDYNSEKLNEVINTQNHISKCIEAINYLDGKNKKMIVFCSNIAQCDTVAKALKADGFKAESVHSKKHDKINEAILHAFKYNEPYREPSLKNNGPTLFDEKDSKELPMIEALVSVNKLSTGYSVTDLQLGVLMAPTEVKSKFVQQTGRLCRIHPGKKFAEILDLAKCVSTHGKHTEEYNPPKRTMDLEADKALMATIKASIGLPNLDLALDGDNPQEIDVSRYNLIIKELKNKEEKAKAKKSDITKISMKDLAAIYDITNDHHVVLKVACEIYTRKFGRPISKKGFPYNYDPEWLGELIQPVFDEFPEAKHRFLKGIKTRCRNIIKEHKNMNSIRFFITWMADKHRESESPAQKQIDERNEMLNKPNEIELDEDFECPF